MLIDNILNGLGVLSHRGSSRSPQASSTTSIPLTQEEKNAKRRGGSYSSSGVEVERWYIDEETGRKYYTVGDKAGTWEQVQEPKTPPANPQTESTTNPPAGANNLQTKATDDAQTDNNDTWLWIGVLTTFGLVAYKALKKGKKK